MACGTTLTDAWLAAIEALLQQPDYLFDLVVTIGDPRPECADQIVKQELDNVLANIDSQRVETVANTIFPEGLAQASGNRAELYRRYIAMLPRLRRQRGNQRGTYFGRLIEYPLIANGTYDNQIERVVQDLTRQLHGRAPRRSGYEMQVFAPGKDGMSRGFPCLSSLSFRLDGDHLRLTAAYRSQWYLEKALGNFLGLARLQRFVAQESGLGQGPLVIHAYYASISQKRQIKALLSRIRQYDAASGPAD